MNPVYVAVIFGWSFMVYTFLRGFDVRSTMQLASIIDLQKHEVNPTIAWLTRRMDLKYAMRLTWLAIGVPVAAADAYVNQGFPYGVPIYALIFGFSHVLAAANNKRVAYTISKVGVAEFEREHDQQIREMSKLSLTGKLRLIFKSNPRSVLMLALALPLVAALGYAMVATELFTVVVSHDLVLVIPLNVAFCLIIATLIIEPAFALAPLILARRYRALPMKDKHEGQDVAAAAVNIQVPVSVVVQALESARRNGEAAVRITIPVSMDEPDRQAKPDGGD
jgi:hypothetical protein